MKIVAILAAFNEARLIQSCLEHYEAQGVEVYLLDNESTDATVELARPFLDRNLIAIESFPRRGFYSQRDQLKRKSEIARMVDADWVLHADVDEVRMSPREGETLAQGFARTTAMGWNAVNFLEFTFVPTVEHPNHSPASYLETMRYYYYMAPKYPWHVKAWSPRELPDFDLVDMGGHEIMAKERRLSPEDWTLRHYLFLSLEHAQEKYLERSYDPQEVDMGWHSPRDQLAELGIRLPEAKNLMRYFGEHFLDISRPLSHHPVFGNGMPKGNGLSESSPAPQI